MAPMRGVGGGSTKLREENLEDLVIEAAYAMVVLDNAPEDEGAVESYFLREYRIWIARGWR